MNIDCPFHVSYPMDRGFGLVLDLSVWHLGEPISLYCPRQVFVLPRPERSLVRWWKPGWCDACSDRAPVHITVAAIIRAMEPQLANAMRQHWADPAGVSHVSIIHSVRSATQRFSPRMHRVVSLDLAKTTLEQCRLVLRDQWNFILSAKHPVGRALRAGTHVLCVRRE